MFTTSVQYEQEIRNKNEMGFFLEVPLLYGYNLPVFILFFAHELKVEEVL